tara:strand:- start:2148 stop:3557 length:1410 start_codon:yes stop_codon:yes gene_type:complete
MSDIVKSLLDRANSGNNTWQDMVSAYTRSTNKNSKSLRNLLIGTTLFNAKEFSMQQKVLKNLRENEKEKTFELGKMNQKWDAYSTLLADDEAYKKDPLYFRIKAEQEFNRKNPNFATEYGPNESLMQNKKIADINEYEQSLIRVHEENMKSGEFGSKMTKEEFFKPFNDHYEKRAEEISSPKNLSLVHAGWNKIRRRKDEPVTSKELQTSKNLATRSVLDFLVNPVDFNKQEQIDLYRRKKGDKTFTKEDGLLYLYNNIPDSDVARDITLTTFKNNQQQLYSKSDLDTFIVNAKVDFNPIIEKDRIQTEAFNESWMERNDKKVLPQVGEPGYMSYYLEMANTKDEMNGTGDAKIRQLRRNIFELEDINRIIDDSGLGEGHQMYPVKLKLESDIRLAGIDAIKYEMYKITTASINDPIQGLIIKSQIPELDPQRDNRPPDYLYEYKSLEDYFSKSVNILMSGFDAIFPEE